MIRTAVFSIISISLAPGAVQADIFDAIQDQDIQALSQSISDGEDPSSIDMLQGMPLHLAARAGWIEGIQALIEAGANPFDDDGSGTAIEAAAGNNMLEALKVFESAGYDTLARSESGRAPIHFASRSGSYDVVVYLLARGADPEMATGGRGETPLHHAARGEHLEIVNLLLDHGADPTVICLLYTSDAADD